MLTPAGLSSEAVSWCLSGHQCSASGGGHYTALAEGALELVGEDFNFQTHSIINNCGIIGLNIFKIN